MLSSLASIPSGVGSFLTNRRKTFTWVAGTVGGAYLLGQWGLRRMGDMAEKARIEGADRDNLARRFNLNQEDCQFTVLALLPTLSEQLMEEMDVESCSKELAELAQKSKREQREQRELEERERAALEHEERQQKEGEEATTVQDDAIAPVDQPVAVEERDSTTQDASPADSASDPPEVAALPPTDAQDPPSSYAAAAAPAPSPSPSLLSTSKLSAEAPAFSPFGLAAPAPAPVVEEKEQVQEEQQPSESVLLSRSWAEVVAKGDDKAEEVGSESVSTLPEQAEGPSIEPAEPEKSERTRAKLWEEIKILSFTRTFTSLYLLTLLTLQTHVQLSLLGRASYVASVLSSLPPTPSPDPLSQEMSYDEDLELALYGEKIKKEETEVGLGKEDERRYLTFSWWLLNEGWKGVAERVKSAVEEVVGPMGLKSMIVYGELSTLLGQIRHKVDFNPDGSLYDFSPALFPLTPSDEHRTLLSGGISLSSSGPPVSPELRRLLNETSDTLDSADCALVRKLLLDRLFAQLVEGLEGAFRAPAAQEGEKGSRFEDVGERTARLAGLLPTVARQSRRVLDEVPNEYFVALEDVRELTEFSAIVYSSFDRDNVRGSC